MVPVHSQANLTDMWTQASLIFYGGLQYSVLLKLLNLYHAEYLEMTHPSFSPNKTIHHFFFGRFQNKYRLNSDSADHDETKEVKYN
jgi:hypothetical protein